MSCSDYYEPLKLKGPVSDHSLRSSLGLEEKFLLKGGSTLTLSSKVEFLHSDA